MLHLGAGRAEPTGSRAGLQALSHPPQGWRLLWRPSLPTAFLPALIQGQELLLSCPLFPPSFPFPTGPGQSGNGPEIVTAGPQCLLDITPASSFWAEPGLCLAFPLGEGIPRPCRGAAAPCFPANPRAQAGKRGGSVGGWPCAHCHWLWPCLGVLGMALKVWHT